MTGRTVLLAAAALLGLFSAGCQRRAAGEQVETRKSIVASDTILSGIGEALLPPEYFDVTAILPPGQCPGHYDVKLSDIAKVKKASLVVSFRGMPFMKKAGADAGRQLLIDDRDRNWMAPDAYRAGLNLLADRFSDLYPEHRQRIAERRDRALKEVSEQSQKLGDRIQRAGIARKTILASSMLKEPLAWMGFRIAGDYGRPEALSAKEVAALTRLGKEQAIAAVVDNLQSGPETGKGIAEALGVPHVILSNFPSEKGYSATLSDNVDAMLKAARAK